MQRKHQFTKLPSKRAFFDRQVRPYGQGRTIAIGKLIPKEWKFVRVTVIEATKDKITLSITKLMGEDEVARCTAANPHDRQDT